MTADQAPEPSEHRDPIAFRDALLFWLKLGFISFGGPAGQIAVMHHELVEKRRWISERRFLHALNYCMLLPGPEAQQLATYMGWLMHRTWGGIVAGALFVLPSLGLLIALSWIYLAFGNAPVVAGVLYGIKPAVTAVVAFAAWRIGSKILRNPAMWALAMAAFIAIAILHVAFPIIVGAAALIGVLGGRFVPGWFAIANHVADDAHREPCVIDDDTPTPPHARFDRTRLLWTLATGLLLWALAIGALALMFGVDGVFTTMAWFFTKAALLTFGGAYAVLPYVVQGAVEQHHWLSAAQMIDGLALGETTPGPLIMVVAFVAFVGGWSQAVLGPDHLAAAGATAAGIVTFFTFLPSFLFILLGGPLVETTRRQPHITAPLAAITAAIVGVILNLAVYFALNVLWPDGLGGHFEWPLAAIGLVALVCLIRYRIGVVPVIVACGIAGLLLTLVAG
ncbi:MAG: chromate efflux transporter [Betaproteobacteria bacterium]